MVYYIIGAAIVLWIVGSISRRIDRRGKVICVVEENCVGCRRCVKKCRHNVLEMVKDDSGIYPVIKNPESCSACGNCVDVCKFNALKIIELQRKECL